jgi:DNA polymerase gamma 1
MVSNLGANMGSKGFRYSGGLGSDCFNVMMGRGDEPVQKFPLTGQIYPQTLQVENTGRDFLLTRHNLQIQGTGKHLLECVLLYTKYWCEMFNVDARFILSIHDAAAFEVKDGDVEKFSGILQMAHLYSWATLRQQLGVCEIGLSGAFITTMEVGDFFMKSDKSGTATPINPRSYRIDRYSIGLKESLEHVSKIFT